MDTIFVIPQTQNELLHASHEKYYVKNVYSSNQIPKLLNDVKAAFGTDPQILVNDHFDTFYGVIDNANHIQPLYLTRTFDLLFHILDTLGQHLATFFESNSVNEDQRKTFLNATQMIIYLQCQLIKIIDKKTYINEDVGKRARKDDENVAVTTWDKKRYQFLVQIFNLIQLPLEKLWNPPVVEENFTTLFCDFCYQTIEMKQNKTKPVGDIIFQILGTAVKKYNHAMTLPVKLLEILRGHEHSIILVANGVHLLYDECKIQSIFSNLVKEIVEELSANDGDTQSSKHFSIFLIELNAVAPQMMVPHLSVISDELLNNQSNILRNAILKMIGDALATQLTSEDLSEDMKNVRDDFLEKLFDHLMDVNAHVRAKVLNLFYQLKEENAIPLSYQYKVLDMAVERLEDKGNLVRKNAVVLIKTFLERNPFSAKLSLQEITAKFDEETKKLNEIQEKIASVRKSASDSESKFNELVPKLTVLLKEMRNDSYKAADLAAMVGDVSEVVTKVKDLLTTNELYKAVKLVIIIDSQSGNAELVKSLSMEYYVPYYLTILYEYFIGEISTKEMTEQYAAQAKVVSFFHDSVEFCEKIESALKKLEEFLLSKTSSDVIEVINLFTTGFLFGIKGCENGMIMMLNLVWSTEKEKRDAVVNAYQRVFFTTDKQGRAHAVKVVLNLSNFFDHLSVGYASAFSYLIKEWVECGEIDNQIIQVMFERLTMKIENTTEEESRKALELLAMASNAKHSIAQQNRTLLENIGIEEYGAKDIRYFTTTLQLLQKLVTPASDTKHYKRFDSTHSTISKVVDAYIKFFFIKPIKNFDQITSSVFDLIYHLSESPDTISIKILENIFKVLEEKYKSPLAEEESAGNESFDAYNFPKYLLTRLINLVGYIAMKEMIFLDIDVYNNAKYRQDLNLEKQKKQDKRKTVSLNTSASNALKRLSGTAADQNEDDINGSTATDDRIAEMINHICEKVMLHSDEVILKQLLNTIVEICKHPLHYEDETLFRTSVLTFIRFMAVSSDFCEENMPFLMNILKGTNDIKIKINIIIGMADLMFRFPNIIGSWTKQFYDMLYDDNDEVRLATVKMLSYLIMQEMIRVKGQISDLALCIVDRNDRIRTTTQQFFKEIASKPNTLYNILPDIIARLGDVDFEIEEEKYRTIMKYIFALIEKNRQVESLVDKLCFRFKTTKEERQWRETVFCLTLLTHTEKTIRKLIDHIPLYKDKVQVDEVHNGFKNIILTTGKAAKQELKDILTEFETKLDECLEVRENGQLPTAQLISSTGTTNSESGKKPSKKSVRKPRQKNFRGKKKMALPDSSGAESVDSGSSGSETSPPPKVQKSSKKIIVRNKALSEDEELEQEVISKPKGRSRSSRFRI